MYQHLLRWVLAQCANTSWEWCWRVLTTLGISVGAVRSNSVPTLERQPWIPAIQSGQGQPRGCLHAVPSHSRAVVSSTPASIVWLPSLPSCQIRARCLRANRLARYLALLCAIAHAAAALHGAAPAVGASTPHASALLSPGCVCTSASTFLWSC